MLSSLSTLSACCDVAEQMLLRGFQNLNTAGSTLSDLDKATEILARLTAVRKSLIHLTDRPHKVGRVSDPTPQPSDSPSPNSTSPEHTVARASARDYPSDPPSPDSGDNRQSSIVNRQSPDPSIATIHSIHQIHDLPALPLDRIEPALNRAFADLISLEPSSPERPNQPSEQIHPSDSPGQTSQERRSPGRPADVSTDVSSLDSS